jgi:hypothetical protein
MTTWKGRFIPKNISKYKGDYRNIIYRSSWELKFMKYCDMNENIIEWHSEEIFIPYRSPLDGKIHRYFVDFYIKVCDVNGNFQKYLVEVKPKKQTKEPKKQKRMTKSYIYEVTEYIKNQSKWQAAREYCDDHGMQFKIITETELKI